VTTSDASLETATLEMNELWGTYRSLRDANASATKFEELKKKVRSAKARAKKAGFSTIAQQLTDLGEYIKRYKPREGVVRANPDDLHAELAAIEKTIASPETEARVRRLLERIEESRALDLEGDHDHDEYVDIEERLGVLGFSTTLD
jgi:hypothetical protein